MSQQNILVGSVPNDGTGDPIRTAMIKIQNNFSEFYSSFTPNVSTNNVTAANNLYVTGKVNAASYTIGSTVTANASGIFSTNVCIGTTSQLYPMTISTGPGGNTQGVVSIASGNTSPGTGYISYLMSQNINPYQNMIGAAGQIQFGNTTSTGQLVIGKSFDGNPVISALNNFQIAIDNTNTGTGVFEIAKGSSGGRIGTDGTSLLKILNNGYVGIGNTSPTNLLSVNGTSYFGGNVNAAANVYVTGTVSAANFDNVSDATLKENIIPIENAVATINNLNPVSFTWKNNGDLAYGLIAQEVEQIIPGIVHNRIDGTKTVSYMQLIAFLLQAIKEQNIKIDSLETHINNIVV